MKKGDWYCPKCKNNLDALNVTIGENCDTCNTCGSAVLFIEKDHGAVPIDFLEAVSFIGIGVDDYEIDKKWIYKDGFNFIQRAKTKAIKN